MKNKLKKIDFLLPLKFSVNAVYLESQICTSLDQIRPYRVDSSNVERKKSALKNKLKKIEFPLPLKFSVNAVYLESQMSYRVDSF